MVFIDTAYFLLKYQQKIISSISRKEKTMQRNSFSIKTIGIMACLFLMFVVANIAIAAPPSNGSGPPFVPGQIVVTGGPDGLPAGYDIIKYLPNADLTVVRVESGREWGHIQSLRAKGFRANLNLVAKASAVIDDPYYSLQWHFPMVQSGDAWSLTYELDVTVAVLDTGLATGGDDGIGCIVSGNDIVNSDNDPNDGDGHGTHVSGTIAQNTNNGTGVAGLAYFACIMPVKVLDDNGSGTFADITEGIYYAVNSGADVINMSLGTNARYNLRNDPVMDPALDYAYDCGVTVVCASGNDGSRKNVSYPAIYPTTIAVGAVDSSESVTRYSNKGFGLDLVAPGGDLTKDLNNDDYGDGVLQETLINGNWGYYFFQGTSMASPHVAAVAAMLYSSGTAITPDGVREALTSTALDIEDPGFDNASGYGLVQAYSALNYDYGEYCTDADGDGYEDELCGGDDCDDSDALISPGAAEVCGDGIDNNCDGIDEACSSCLDLGEKCFSDSDCCSDDCRGKCR
jgi:serine protease